MQKCPGGVGVGGRGGRRETGLQLSAVFNVRYVLELALGKKREIQLWSAVSA